MENTNYLYAETTEKIIGCAMKVHTYLGYGFTPFFNFIFGSREGYAVQEVIYQRALEIELRKQGVEFKREFSMNIYYENHKIGARRVDFLVNECISLEIKATQNLDSVHFAQAQNYMEAYNLQVGLLINFGEKSLRFRRLSNTKFKSLESSQNFNNLNNHNNPL